MTALVLGTKTFLQDFLVGWAMATGKINRTLERKGTQRAASQLAIHGFHKEAEALSNSFKEVK